MHFDVSSPDVDIFVSDLNYFLSGSDNFSLEQREFTLQRVKKLLHSKIASIYDMKNNPTKFLAFLDCVTVMDVNLAVKFGVHMTLFGSSVINLGTEKHHKKYLPGIDTFEIAGCFGMTELGTRGPSTSRFLTCECVVGHGSNVQGIETTAHYDAKTKEFIINTPTDSAQKYWLGNAAGTF